MTTGENWNAVLWECMILTNCIMVTENVNATYGNNTSVFIWQGTYLDPIDDSTLLAALPNDIKVSKTIFCTKGCMLCLKRLSSIYFTSNAGQSVQPRPSPCGSVPLQLHVGIVLVGFCVSYNMFSGSEVCLTQSSGLL